MRSAPLGCPSNRVNPTDVVQAFLAANPRLAGTWMSRGRPDRLLIIVRVLGPYPRSAKLVNATEAAMGKDGKAQPVPLGEWRVDGSQSIVPPSIHPETQQPYEVVSFNAPVLVEYNEIVWPPMVGNPPTMDIAIDPAKTHNTVNTLLSTTELLKDVTDKRPV